MVPDLPFQARGHRRPLLWEWPYEDGGRGLSIFFENNPKHSRFSVVKSAPLPSLRGAKRRGSSRRAG